MKRSGNVGESLDEPSIEVHKAQERLKFLDTSWHWPVAHSINFYRVHLDLVFRENESQKLYLLHFEKTLFWFQVEVVVLQYLEDSLHCQSMLFQGFGEDQYVIHINDNHSFINQLLEQIVHHRLEGCWAVA